MRIACLLVVGVVASWAIVAKALGPYVPPGMPDPTMQGSPGLAPSSEFNLVGRYQVSAYGSPSGNGCYIIDTTTGRTWRAASGHAPQLVGELPQQPSAAFLPPPTMQEPTLMNAEPTPSVIEPSPSVVPSIEVPEGELSPMPDAPK
jgi:hypothetical protein